MSSPRRLRIAYLLEDMDLWGGVNNVIEQSHALMDRGHDVTIVTRSGPPRWRSIRVPLRRVWRFRAKDIPECDAVVATYWTTVAPAVDSGRGLAVHLCQGYEPCFAELARLKSRIDAAYRSPTLLLTVHEPLVRLLRERCGREAINIGQGLDPTIFFPGPDRSESSPSRLLLVGPTQIPWKGILEGLEAVARVKEHSGLRLVRASQFAMSRAERRLGVTDEYHVHLPAERMAELYRSADLFVAPSWSAEGVGLPLLEALACGVPSAASDIPSFRAFAPDAAWTAWFPERDVTALADAVDRLARDPALRSSLRRRGLGVAERYRFSAVAERIEAALYAAIGA